MKTEIQNKIQKLLDKVDEIDYTLSELTHTVSESNEKNNIDCDIYSIYIDGEAKFLRGISIIKEALIQFIIFENKPF